jgi:hypothetical protein
MPPPSLPAELLAIKQFLSIVAPGAPPDEYTPPPETLA